MNSAEMSAGLRKRQSESSGQFGMICSTKQCAGGQAGLPAGANELGHHCTCASVAKQAGQPLLPICPLHPDACLRALLNLFLLSCASRSEPCERHAVARCPSATCSRKSIARLARRRPCEPQHRSPSWLKASVHWHLFTECARTTSNLGILFRLE